MNSYEKLLLENKAWAFSSQRDDPEFFERLKNVQTPEFLWIGCSDSRVPADKITGTQPGEIFVHRNIANLVVHTDFNLLSVLEYAVNVLEVKHIIVCGHYNCGGVKAALGNQNIGLINKWLRNIKDVYMLHKKEIDGFLTEEEKLNKMVELNVIEQVNNLTKTSIIQSAWKNKKAPDIHGWVYGINDGIIVPICEKPAGSSMDDPIYQYDF